jgi:hypothetical protein
MSDGNGISLLEDALSADAPTQRQIIATWLAMIEAQQKAEQAAKASEEANLQARKAEQARIALVEAGIEEVQRLKALSPQVSLLITTLHDEQDGSSAKLSHINYILSLLLEATRIRLEGVQTKEEKENLATLIKDIQQVEFDFVKTEEVGLREQIRWHRRSLSELKIQEAMYGSTPPVWLLNQISDAEEKITAREAELKQLLTQRQHDLPP